MTRHSLLQDKENRQTPSTAYVSSRLGLTSPALHTPSHAGTANLEDLAASNAKLSCDDANAASTPAMGAISSYMLPFMLDKARGTPSSAAASVPPSTGAAVAPAAEYAAAPAAENAAAPVAETALPVGAFCDGGFTSRADPSNSLAHDFNPYNLAKEQRTTEPQTRVSNACTMALHSKSWWLYAQLALGHTVLTAHHTNV